MNTCIAGLAECWILPNTRIKHGYTMHAAVGIEALMGEDEDGEHQLRSGEMRSSVIWSGTCNRLREKS